MNQPDFFDDLLNDDDAQRSLTVLTLAYAERRRQIALGYTTEHDDEHGALYQMRTCALLILRLMGMPPLELEALDAYRRRVRARAYGALLPEEQWAWLRATKVVHKYDDDVQPLVIATALLVAETERELRRLASGSDATTL